MAVDGFSVLDDYLRHWLGTVPAPGLALSITDHNVTRHTASLGYSDATSGRPVFDDTTFQIGSIGKSMTALALMQLVEAGRLDLNAPLSTHLPWFAPTSRYGPIALKHVMSHTAGLPSGSDFTPASRYEAYALRDVEAAWEPGERFHYSNTGYKMLGWLLEDVARAPYGVIISRRVLQPLGMNATDAVVTHPTRHRMATGHVPLHDDRPYRTGDTLIPATWMQYDAGDGSPAATAGDMARYARMWLNGGRSPIRAIVSSSSFDRMISPVIRMSRGDAYENDYGYGFGIISHVADGHNFIGHGGSTVGFQAIMLIDRNGGLGVTLLCNGNGVDTYAPARYALQVAAAARDGYYPGAAEHARPATGRGRPPLCRNLCRCGQRRTPAGNSRRRYVARQPSRLKRRFVNCRRRSSAHRRKQLLRTQRCLRPIPAAVSPSFGRRQRDDRGVPRLHGVPS